MHMPMRRTEFHGMLLFMLLFPVYNTMQYIQYNILF